MSGIMPTGIGIPDGSAIATAMLNAAYANGLVNASGHTITALGPAGATPVAELIGDWWASVSNSMGLNVGGFAESSAPAGSVFNPYGFKGGGGGSNIGMPGTSFGNAYWGTSTQTAPVHVIIDNPGAMNAATEAGVRSLLPGGV